jgi:tetratricopeptide (TPR) repeat protein
MWTESILRLLKQGHRFGEALKEWKQKPGEDARVAALGKEIAGLSNGARRVLFVASLLRECSRAELISITSFGNTELDQAVNELQILFLVDAPKIIENEPRFSVAESTALAMKECADNFVRDHKKLTAAVRYFRSQVSSDAGAGARKKVAHVVTQTVALLGTEQFDKAMETVDAALATSPDHPDLLMLRGRCLRSTQPAEALVEFESAFNVGQRKPILFDMWYQASIDRSAFSTSISVCERAVASELDRSIWLPRRARALVQVAFRHYRDGNVARSLATLRSSIDDLANAIEAVSGSVKQAAVYRRDLASVVDTALSISAVETSLEIILARFDLLCDAIHRGDRRAENAGRVVGLVEALVSGVDFEAASGVERASRVRIHDGIKALTAARQCLTVASEDYQVFDLSIERLERLIPNSRA